MLSSLDSCVTKEADEDTELQFKAHFEYTDNAINIEVKDDAECYPLLVYYI